ncbi:hypothetical protein [Vulcanisaeta distributa]|uniref:hypothetical protein n=1 Tax=Vulcanisaeta distributa TaxID=164451 RepID=UPI000AA4722C|nr:hypothetical protein [Vulcanisaeta distributa]
MRICSGRGGVNNVRLLSFRGCGDLNEVISGDAVVVPSSASVRMAICMTMLAAQRGVPIMHVMFPFGPWTNLFYPLVPRWLQWVQLFGKVSVNQGPNNVLRQLIGDCDEFIDKLKGVVGINILNSDLRREVARVSCLINTLTSTPHVYEDDNPKPNSLRLELSKGELRLLVDNTLIESVRLRTNPTYSRDISNNEAVNMDRVRKLIEAILNCVGDEDDTVDQMIRFFGFRVMDIEDGGDYVIDTNTIYHGIHNLPVRVEIPYCVQVEVLHAVAEEKSGCRSVLAKAVELAFEQLRLRAAYVPTAPYKCDVVIPTTDRIVLRGGKKLLTMDKKAHELWLKYGLDSELITNDRFRNPSNSELDHAIIQLYAFTKILNQAP